MGTISLYYKSKNEINYRELLQGRKAVAFYIDKMNLAQRDNIIGYIGEDFFVTKFFDEYKLVFNNLPDLAENPRFQNINKKFAINCTFDLLGNPILDRLNLSNGPTPK